VIGPTQSRGLTLYWLPVLLLFFVPALILVTANFNYANPAFASLDQKYSHLPTIRYIAAHGASIDYSHFISRSAPGYYLLMAAVDHWITDSIVGLRLFNLVITAGLVAVWTFSLSSLCKSPLVVVLAAPFLFSDSIYTRGLWLSTDNLAWLSVVAIMLIGVQYVNSNIAISAAAFFVPAAVGVRQIHAWTIPFLLVAALVGGGLHRAVRMLAAIVPALLLITYFLLTWHGLEPPGGQARYSGFSLAALPMMFSLMGIFGLFYAAAIWQEIRNMWCNNPVLARRFVYCGMSSGAIAGLVPGSTFESFHRQSGIWVLAQHTPVFLGRSPAVTVLAVLGGLIGSLVFLAMARRDRLIFATSIICFTVAQTANSSIFERYYEPLVLIVLGFATARIVQSAGEASRWESRAAGPALLTGIQIALTIWRLSTPFHDFRLR
jgi:hypothetical protein